MLDYLPAKVKPKLLHHCYTASVIRHLNLISPAATTQLAVWERCDSSSQRVKFKFKTEASVWTSFFQGWRRNSVVVLCGRPITLHSAVDNSLVPVGRRSAHLLSHEKIKIKFSTSVPRRRWAPPLHQTARSTLIGGASHHRSHAPIPRSLGVISSSYVLCCLWRWVSWSVQTFCVPSSWVFCVTVGDIRQYGFGENCEYNNNPLVWVPGFSAQQA